MRAPEHDSTELMAAAKRDRTGEFPVRHTRIPAGSLSAELRGCASNRVLTAERPRSPHRAVWAPLRLDLPRKVRRGGRDHSPCQVTHGSPRGVEYLRLSPQAGVQSVVQIGRS